MGRRAWAKVNLYLHVTARRPDGFHELDGLVARAGVGDHLTFAPAEGLALEIDGPFADAVPRGENNLVLRAARALAQSHGGSFGARIRLTKVLPVAAGLGGGSADAAAALEGLTRLWGVSPERSALMKLALGLGADVPICLYGRPAFVGGVGEAITRAPPLPATWLVLANPGMPLATPEVFRVREGAFSTAARWSEVAPDAPGLAECLASRTNDLELPAGRLVPEIGQVLEALGQTRGSLLARMSGSGATCFGLFATRDEAWRAAENVAARNPAWWVAPAPLLHGKLDEL